MIFATITNVNSHENISRKQECLSLNLIQTQRFIYKQHKTKNFDTKAEQWRTWTRNIWQIQITFSRISHKAKRNNQIQCLIWIRYNISYEMLTGQLKKRRKKRPTECPLVNISKSLQYTTLPISNYIHIKIYSWMLCICCIWMKCTSKN